MEIKFIYEPGQAVFFLNKEKLVFAIVRTAECIATERGIEKTYNCEITTPPPGEREQKYVLVPEENLYQTKEGLLNSLQEKFLQSCTPND